MEKYKNSLISTTHEGNFDSQHTPELILPLPALVHHPDISTPAVIAGNDIKNTIDE